MTEQEGGGAIGKFIEGGLPQVIAGPAGKAISRLIGATVDIPVEWLEGISQGIRDRREGRSTVAKAVAEQAAQIAVADPVIMDRAMASMLNKEFRRQKNKEAVAQIALESLADEPADPVSTGPEEDWLNAFERYAEDATSDDMREMFGRLLAGEIRKPGIVPRVGLHMVSMLTKESAQLIKRVLPYCDDTGLCYLACITPPMKHSEITRIEQAGFWSSGKTLTLDTMLSLGKEERRGCVSLLQFDEGSARGHISIAMISDAGKALVEAAKVPFLHESLANILRGKGATGVRKVMLVGKGKDRKIYNVML